MTEAPRAVRIGAIAMISVLAALLIGPLVAHAEATPPPVSVSAEP